MEREEIIETIYNYCAVMIDYFNMKEFLALETMDRDRCPLSMASPQLYNEMQDAIADWCDENETAYEFDLSDIDPEEVLLG